MASTRWAAALAAGVTAAGISIGVAWAGGPGGTVDDSPGPPGSYGGMFSAVGSGTFENFADGVGRYNVEVGYNAYGNTAAEAEAGVVGQCQAEGGVSCSADMVTNDNLCIAVVVDINTRVDVGGAGPTVEAARLNAVERAAANGTPVSPNSPVLISDCP